MTTHQFKRQNEDALITLPCHFNKDEFTLALDTGASHTTIDINVLYMEGYTPNDIIRTTQFEGATAVFDAHIFKLKKLTYLGITKYNVEVAAYDFFAYHLLPDFDGLLGLDFFNEHKFCIDFKKNLISMD